MGPDKSDKIVCTIEARMTSTRLPGKVLLPLAGKASLQFQIERIMRSRYVDCVVVATTVNPQDDPIVELCGRIGCNVFRGSEEDVLGRVLGAVRFVDGDLLVETTGDCPLVDHRHIDKLIELFYSGDFDYVSNVVERSFPDGFDVQVFPTAILAEIDTLTADPVHRVHVSNYIYNHPQRYRLGNWKASGVMNWPELGLTLDEQADYALLQVVVNRLLSDNEDFSAEDVVALLRQNPEMVTINAHVQRKTMEEK